MNTPEEGLSTTLEILRKAQNSYNALYANLDDLFELADAHGQCHDYRALKKWEKVIDARDELLVNLLASIVAVRLSLERSTST